MFNRKKYYVSSLSLKNIYLVKKELQSQSAYEKRMQTIDEYNTEYVILFEKIGNYLPNEKDFMFNLPFHESVIYPVDLVEISNMYVTKNELGYVYPISVLDYDSLDHVFANCSKDKKVKTLKQLCAVLENIHNNGIFLN